MTIRVCCRKLSGGYTIIPLAMVMITIHVVIRNAGRMHRHVADGSGQGMVQVLLVDDNPIFRLGLCQLIKTARPDLGIRETESFAKARALLRSGGDIGLVMMDIKVPDGGGFVGLFQLRSEFPHIPIIVISASINAESVSRAVAFGAAGYISKSAPCEVIERTLKSSLSKDWAQVPIIASENQVSPIAALSPAQLRVLRGLKRGLRNKQIAFELGLSEKTVKAYMSTLYRKLGVSSRTQALVLVQEMSLDSPVFGDDA
jgi:DNA-binding NarL/FixJ family response regulator